MVVTLRTSLHSILLKVLRLQPMLLLEREMLLQQKLRLEHLFLNSYYKLLKEEVIHVVKTEMGSLMLLYSLQLQD